MTNCKVISCYFGNRKKYPFNEKNSIEVLKDVIKNEISLNPGVKQLDTILVNHNCNQEKANKYLDSIDGLETYSGKIKVIHRPWNNGIGASFGSFNYAFEQFRDEYDYWFFQEDDYKIIYKNYYSEGIEMLNKNKNLGFVGFDRGSIAENSYGLNGFINYFLYDFLNDTSNNIIDKYIHDIRKAEDRIDIILNLLDTNDLCHGGMGLTHRDVLNKIYKKNGSLPYYDKPNPGFDNIDEYELWWWLFVFLGEMQFPNSFSEYGYKVSLFNKSNKPLIYTYKGKEKR